MGVCSICGLALSSCQSVVHTCNKPEYADVQCYDGISSRTQTDPKR